MITIIRNYKKSDREAVREICCQTAFMGDPLEIFFANKKIFADIWTKYYTDYEPESIFVAEEDGKVVGYITGCLNEEIYDKIFSKYILPELIKSFLKLRVIFNNKNFKFFFNSLKSSILGEFKLPDIPDCKAHLHINVTKAARKKGVGKKLMLRFFKYLKDNKIKKVELSTTSEQGAKFFKAMGFKKIYSGKVSQWRYLLKKDVEIALYTKEIL